jgi:hypothetical protein
MGQREFPAVLFLWNEVWMKYFLLLLVFLGLASKALGADLQQPSWMLQIQEQTLPSYTSTNGFSVSGHLDGLDLSYFSSASNNWGIAVRSNDLSYGHNSTVKERIVNPRYRRYSKEGLWRPFFQVGLQYLGEWANPDDYPNLPANQLSFYELGGDMGFGVGRIVHGVAVEFLLDGKALYSSSPYSGPTAYSNYHFGLGYAW